MDTPENVVFVFKGYAVRRPKIRPYESSQTFCHMCIFQCLIAGYHDLLESSGLINPEINCSLDSFLITSNSVYYVAYCALIISCTMSFFMEIVIVNILGL